MQKLLFFWNIDGDDTYFTLDSLDDKELLFKLKEIEIITKKINIMQQV